MVSTYKKKENQKTDFSFNDSFSASHSLFLPSSRDSTHHRNVGCLQMLDYVLLFSDLIQCLQFVNHGDWWYPAMFTSVTIKKVKIIHSKVRKFKMHTLS